MLPGGAATARESQKVPGVAGNLTGVVAPCQVRVRASTVIVHIAKGQKFSMPRRPATTQPR